MNKRDMQQLKASIAKDLVQGQSDNSATRDLLKQYVPLNGIVSKPEPEIQLKCLWKTAWHHMPPWHRTTFLPGTVPPWHLMLPWHHMPP